jgi:hypothetical protein
LSSIEAHAVALLGGMQLDGNVDEPEADGSFPKRSRHGQPFSLFRVVGAPA